MAHCAEIDNQGIVKRVIVVEEMYGDLTCEEWCEKTYGGMWKKTSYNTFGGQHRLGGVPFRMNYACIGGKFDSINNAFIPPIKNNRKKWRLNLETFLYEPPIQYPKDGKVYNWSDIKTNWIPIKIK